MACEQHISAFQENQNLLQDLGDPTNLCSFCGAYYWGKEKNSNGKYNACCQQGNFVIPKLNSPHPYLNDLFQGNSAEAKQFKKNPELLIQGCHLLQLQSRTNGNSEAQESQLLEWQDPSITTLVLCNQILNQLQEIYNAIFIQIKI